MLPGDAPRHLIIAVLLLLLISANITGIANTAIHKPIYDSSDSAYYFQRSREIAQGNWDTESIIVSHLTRYPEVQHPAFDHWQPLVPIFSGLAGRAIGDPVIGARFVLLLFASVLCPVLLFSLIVACGGSKITALFATAVFFSWIQLDYFRLLLETVFFSACFLLLAILCIVIGVIKRPAPSRILAVCAGSAFGLMACTRGDGLPVAIVLMILIVVGAPKAHRASAGLSLLAGFSLAFAPLAVRNMAVFGHPISIGMTRVLSVTDFSQWGAFDLMYDPSLRELLVARYVASRRAIEACMTSPVAIASLGCVVLVLLVGLGRRSHRNGLSAGETTVILLTSLPYVLYMVVGVLLAPAMTLWFHRSPVPYLPLLLSSGTIAAERLGRHMLHGVWRWLFFIGLAILLAPGLSPDPRRFVKEIRYDPTIAAQAASWLPPEAVVMTNLTFALYAERGGNLVRLPNNGLSAVAEAIDHYGVEFVVLFRDVPWTEGLAHELRSKDPFDPASNIGLESYLETDRYTIYRVRVTHPRPATGSGTE